MHAVYACTHVLRVSIHPFYHAFIFPDQRKTSILYIYTYKNKLNKFSLLTPIANNVSWPTQLTCDLAPISLRIVQPRYILSFLIPIPASLLPLAPPGLFPIHSLNTLIHVNNLSSHSNYNLPLCTLTTKPTQSINLSIDPSMHTCRPSSQIEQVVTTIDIGIQNTHKKYRNTCVSFEQ